MREVLVVVQDRDADFFSARSFDSLFRSLSSRRDDYWQYGTRVKTSECRKAVDGIERGRGGREKASKKFRRVKRKQGRKKGPGDLSISADERAL
jgi:hypothetical protein